MGNDSIDFGKIKTYSIYNRKNKVSIRDFSKGIKGAADFVDTIPNILAGKDIKEVIDKVIKAKEKGKPVIAAIGAHVIKCGLSPVLIELIKEGMLDGIAMNGAGSIHDFELAMIGETSEDVEAGLDEGMFGMSEETGRDMNIAIRKGLSKGNGMGKSLGEFIIDNNFKYCDYSLLAAGIKYDIPITIHVAIGTDIIHMHPEADGASIGEASYRDFKLYTARLKNLSGGGVYFNIGSSVILPEVFLKAFTINQNLGYNIQEFYAVNMDMTSQYRSITNVVKRPTNNRGKGYNLIGMHEVLLPLIAYGVLGRTGGKNEV